MDRKQIIKFIKNEKSIMYTPDRRVDTFYQICQFRNPDTKQYQTRKIFFNEREKIVKVYEKEYKKDMIKRFIGNTQDNKYKLYPTTLISNIAIPNASDMSIVRSSLISNDGRPRRSWIDTGLDTNGVLGGSGCILGSEFKTSRS